MGDRVFTERDVLLLMRFAHIEGYKQGRGLAFPAFGGWYPRPAIERFEREHPPGDNLALSQEPASG